MKTMISLLLCLLLLSACSQETVTATKTVTVPDSVKKTIPSIKPSSDKDMMLNSTGIDLIKFGASLEDVKKILNVKQIKTDQISDDGNTLLFASEVLNVDGIPVPRLFLRFNPKNLLSSIEFTSNADTWKTTETNAVKWSDKITELLGKPTKSSNISAELFNDVVKSTEHKSWKKNNISVKSNTNIHSAYGAKLEYDVAFLIEHTKFVNKSKNTGIYVTPDSLTKAGKRIKAKHSDWDDDSCNSVGIGRIRVGMTKEQVRAAWGRPYAVNTTTTGYGTREQWVMQEIGSSYVYFEDGICTAIQN
jgi:outer membrane protein assembly factor BamE (lipoprotein component of BamABCDE complex)